MALANGKDKAIDAQLVEDIAGAAAAGEISEAMVAAEGEDRVTWFVWLLVGCSSISGLLFGYDTGVISGALVTIGGDLGPAELSSGQKELITSSTTLGALLGGLVAGVMSDYLGRRWVLGIADIIFIAGAIGQAVSHAVWPMIGGRFVIGVAVGIAACVAPVYIQELSPTRLRGRMVVLNVVMITGGQVVAYGIDAAFQHLKVAGAGWSGSAPMWTSAYNDPPEQLHRRPRDYDEIYAYATPEQIDLKSVEITKSTTFLQRVKILLMNPANRRALIVGCGLQAFQQLSGFNTLMYYSATLFQEVGFDQPIAYIDIIGRRRIMLFSAPGMVFSLALAAIAFHFLTLKTGSELIAGTQYSQAWSAVVLLSMILYVASYATGLGNVPWQQGELFALEVRGLGTSLCTSTNWAGNLLIGSTYLSLMDAITPAGTFGLYAGICALGCAFCWACFPETAGLSLEEVQMVFKRGFGIKESARLREEKRAMMCGERGAQDSASSAATDEKA
ncbi:general substrate transporter [Epithele typhae]|uniref:general substrate transporter n=1 Tax=Epithele typhae TaxID=378194 RepID=UPI002008A341|nr:general substrate transporter [Epithele typhae]KAH9929117.1 general substrate transporter [Epithele typhae]